jgi:hypothetical protein
MAAPMDIPQLKLTSEAVPVATQIQTAAGSVTATAGAFTVSDTGVLAYQRGGGCRSFSTLMV